MTFSLHLFTSSSQTFSIPFVGGSGPSRWQIRSSQSIGNKGQLEGTAETKDNGSKRIRKWRDSRGAALHGWLCNFHFEMEKCVLSNSPRTPQTVQRLSLKDVRLGPRRRHFLHPRQCPKARRLGRNENHWFAFLSQSASRCGLAESQDEGEMMVRVNYCRWCFLREQQAAVEAPLDGDRP